MGSDCAGIAEAVANSRGIRGKTIRFREIGGQFKLGVLAKLDQKPNVMGEGKVSIATRDSCLQRLLNGLLSMESHRRIRHSLRVIQRFGRSKILPRESK